jgi:TetR/AcrR family transcriptional repressor of mexJK operon
MVGNTTTEAAAIAGASSRPSDGSRSARKRTAVLDAATTAFLQNGYRGTSMDEIAALARVSKQTVYKHFADKERLFTEIVMSAVDDAGESVLRDASTLGSTHDLGADLARFAREQLAQVLQPRLIQLRRLVIGEAGRFPELGRIFYERGGARSTGVLARAFEQLATRGLLAIEDPALAAAHFNWLTMAAPVNQAMLLGDDAIPTGAERDRYADGGARAFLAAYATGALDSV